VIFAEPSTTTGSIGIFGFKLDLSRLLTLLSLNVEVYRRGPHADQQAAYRPWTAEERLIAEQKIRHLYEMFTETVAAGRKLRGLTPAAVDQVGRGHVWTGAQARARGLVDEFGGVVAAVDRAASLGGIPLQFDEAPELVVLPRPSRTIIQSLAGLAEARAGGPDGASGYIGAALSGLPPGSGVIVAPDGGSALPGRLLQRLPPDLKAAARLAAPYLFGRGEGMEARLPFDLDIR
jgi:protease-4